MDDLVERLQSLYVWPQSVADHHADTLTPRQIEKLYEVGNVAEQAAARITDLETALAEAEGRVIAEVVSWLRGQADWHDKNDDGWSGFDRIAQGYREAVDALETGEWKK